MRGSLVSEAESPSLREIPRQDQAADPPQREASEQPVAPHPLSPAAGIGAGGPSESVASPLESVADPMAPFDDRALPPVENAPAASAGARSPLLVDPAAPFDVRQGGTPGQSAATTPTEPSSDTSVDEPPPSVADSFPAISLMQGESIEAALNFDLDDDNSDLSGREVFVLTNKRLIRLAVESRRRVTTFVAVGDVDSAEVRTDRQGFGGYIWGALAFFVAAMLWFSWDHPIGSVAGPVAVALMGAYLVIDQFLAPALVAATFTAGSSGIKCRVSDAASPADVSAFVNRVFEIKAQQ